MKTYNLAKEILVVEVNPNLTKWDIKYDYLRGYDKYGIYDTIKLPSTGYQILSLSKEITEDKAKMIMPSGDANPSGDRYVDGYPISFDSYEPLMFWEDITALESFHSFMQSNNLDYNSLILFKDKWHELDNLSLEPRPFNF